MTAQNPGEMETFQRLSDQYQPELEVGSFSMILPKQY